MAALRDDVLELCLNGRLVEDVLLFVLQLDRREAALKPSATVHSAGERLEERLGHASHVEVLIDVETDGASLAHAEVVVGRVDLHFDEVVVDASDRHRVPLVVVDRHASRLQCFRSVSDVDYESDLTGVQLDRHEVAADGVGGGAAEEDEAVERGGAQLEADCEVLLPVVVEHEERGVSVERHWVRQCGRVLHDVCVQLDVAVVARARQLEKVLVRVHEVLHAALEVGRLQR